MTIYKSQIAALCKRLTAAAYNETDIAQAMETAGLEKRQIDDALEYLSQISISKDSFSTEALRSALERVGAYPSQIEKCMNILSS